ncbi:hypothetical protein E4U28_006893 [Claviceps purpurea]|nr:hypothetical protein E4U28_006893 [Claviceps purpurea]KAG6229664.1 hypothetical protein E4U26_008556 [Claviceps purpurea]
MAQQLSAPTAEALRQSRSIVWRWKGKTLTRIEGGGRELARHLPVLTQPTSARRATRNLENFMWGASASWRRRLTNGDWRLSPGGPASLEPLTWELQDPRFPGFQDAAMRRHACERRNRDRLTRHCRVPAQRCILIS